MSRSEESLLRDAFDARAGAGAGAGKSNVGEEEKKEDSLKQS